MFTVVQLAISVGETNEVTNICRSLDKAALQLHKSQCTMQYTMHCKVSAQSQHTNQCTMQCHAKHICAKDIASEMHRTFEHIYTKWSTLHKVSNKKCSAECKWTLRVTKVAAAPPKPVHQQSYQFSLEPPVQSKKEYKNHQQCHQFSLEPPVQSKKVQKSPTESPVLEPSVPQKHTQYRKVPEITNSRTVPPAWFLLATKASSP